MNLNRVKPVECKRKQEKRKLSPFEFPERKAEGAKNSNTHYWIWAIKSKPPLNPREQQKKKKKQRTFRCFTFLCFYSILFYFPLLVCVMIFTWSEIGVETEENENGRKKIWQKQQQQWEVKVNVTTVSVVLWGPIQWMFYYLW